MKNLKNEEKAERVVLNKSVDADDVGLRLDKYISQLYPGLPYGRIQNLIRTKQVKVNGKRAENTQRLEKGDIVRIPPIEERKTEEKTGNLDLKKMMVFKDENIIVLNKPSGVAVQGGSKIKDHIAGSLASLKCEKPTVPQLVHRLDKETSGVLLLARTPRVARELGEQFREEHIQKTYIAEVEGRLDEPEGKIDAPILKQFEKMTVDPAGQKAVTLYKVEMNEGERTVVRLSPKTGRTHQLRVHMAHLGHPIVGDTKYGAPKQKERLLLHAWQIRFNLMGKSYEIKTPLPSELKGKVFE